VNVTWSALLTLAAGVSSTSRSEASTPLTGSVKVITIEVSPVTVLPAVGICDTIRGLLGLFNV
jgi:hypothetical protein